MNNSGTTDPTNDDQKTGGLNFTRDRGLILDHPITIGRDPSERINRVKTFYGQAVYGPVGSTPFLRFSDTAIYDSENGQQSAAAGAGPGAGYGAGRVVVMGEAAELSAQLAGLEPMGMNVPGIDNRQMALNIVRWLAALEPRTTAVAAAVTYDVPYAPLATGCSAGFSGSARVVARLPAAAGEDGIGAVVRTLFGSLPRPSRDERGRDVLNHFQLTLDEPNLLLDIE